MNEIGFARNWINFSWIHERFLAAGNFKGKIRQISINFLVMKTFLKLRHCNDLKLTRIITPNHAPSLQPTFNILPASLRCQCHLCKRKGDDLKQLWLSNDRNLTKLWWIIQKVIPNYGCRIISWLSSMTLIFLSSRVHKHLEVTRRFLFRRDILRN